MKLSTPPLKIKRIPPAEFCSLCLLVVLCCAPSPVLAANRTVTNLNDSGAGSLRGSVAASASGDTINFGVIGTITLTSGQLTIDRTLVINGPGAGSLTVRRSSAAGTPEFRIFRVTSGPVVSISGLTVSNGFFSTLETGGGISNAGNLTLQDCTLSSNRARLGGGIENSGTLTVQNSTVSGNSVSGLGGGGGIYNQGTLTAQDCSLSGNSASTGGAVYNFGPLTVQNCALSGNIASTGGGIHTVVSLTVRNCNFAGNSAYDRGGGLLNAASGPTEVQGSTFSNNTADTGGAIANPGTLVLQNSTLSGNTANSGGGAIYNGGQGSNIPDLKLTNCTLSQNTAGSGGGLYNDGSENGAIATATLLNTVLKTGAFSANLFNNLGTISSEGHNLSNDNGGGFLTGPGDRINTDPKLGTLKNNGGPTSTLSLLAGSPAINGGDDSVLAAPLGLTTDQRGAGFPRKVGAAVEIGAFEQDVFQTGATLVVNTLAEHDDGACGVSDCTLLEALNASNSNPDANTINFQPGLTGTILNTLVAGGLNIVNPVAINGPGARVLLISGNFARRIFNIAGGVSVSVSGLTIAYGSSGFGVSGGAINNVGALTLLDCAVINSQGGSGGGLVNTGTLSVTGCTFSGNVSSGHGGAIRNASDSTISASAVITNSTFWGNNAFSSGAIASSGTAALPASVTLTGCSINSNSAGDGTSGIGGGVYNWHNGTITLRNTIVAGNNAVNNTDVAGAFTSQGYNLIGVVGSATGFTSTGDRAGVAGLPIDARVSVLQNNGGPTNTLALLAGSPALDKGNRFGLAGDQRGLTRPVDEPGIANAGGGDGSDIGAFEQEISQTGATLVVNTLAEHDDGACGATDCSLFEAINAANANSDANTITFKAGLTGTILNTLAPIGLHLTNPVTITGPGARVLTVSGNFASRVFFINPGVTATISGLTIANGNGGGNYSGGGIYSGGNLTLLNCAVLNNNNGSGGGIASAGALTITGCTFAGNTSTGHGGAVRIASDTVNATAVITNSTFTGNTSVNSGALTPSGTAALPATMTVTGCTISRNLATGAGSTGGGLFNYHDATIVVRNTLVADNNATNFPDVAGTFNSQGYNLIRIGDGGNFVGGANNDQVGDGDAPRNANLGALANNGGPTDTMALLAGSPAFDKGKNFGLTTDQRGEARPHDDPALANATGGDGSDIGAFELALPHSISGRIANAGGTAIAGVSVSRGTGTTAALTDSNGNYTLTGLNLGSYTLTPSKSGTAFSPATRTVIISSGNVTGQNFTGYNATLDGRVAFSNGTGIANVQVRLNTGRNAFTNRAGYYTFTGMPPGAYTVTPVLAGYSFDPTYRQVTIGSSSVGNINFIGGYTISGRIANSAGAAIVNQAVTRSGSATPVYSNSAGYYFFYGIVNGSYTITPTAGAYGFTPQSRSVTVNGASVSGQNFTGTTGYSVTGRIATSNGTAIAGVTVTRTGGSAATTNSAGYYTFNGVPNGTYTLTPGKAGLTFTPASKSVTVGGANVSGQNFTGSP